MQSIDIINPAAGKGKAPDAADASHKFYITKGVGDARRYTADVCRSFPETHFNIYGGDGTVNEVVNGIMDAGAGNISSISVIPFGTGNDFAKNFVGAGTKNRIDLIKYNGKYAVNMLNMGLDCDAAIETAKIKNIPHISGSMAYILGVVKVFFHKKCHEYEITLTDTAGKVEHFKDQYLLCSIANGCWYGGGFKNSPISRTDDGLVEMLIVKNVSSFKFISLIGAYRKGLHIDSGTGMPVDKFKKFMSYRSCKKIQITGMKYFCSDGEIENAESLEIEVAPAALNYIS